mmetsp:Transcript_13935/g.20071  ORF Transcript_13935/g.20071 Transcript_13935/m.20071 type:complete len:107 (-) Transcript_13935:2017-2337(-)
MDKDQNQYRLFAAAGTTPSPHHRYYYRNHNSTLDDSDGLTTDPSMITSTRFPSPPKSPVDREVMLSMMMESDDLATIVKKLIDCALAAGATTIDGKPLPLFNAFLI